MNQDDQKVDPRTESFNNEIVNSNLSSLVATDTPKPAQVRPISSGPPTFSDEELERLETAKSFARSIQQVYLQYLELQDHPSSAASTPATTSVNVLQLHNLSLLSRIYIGSIHFDLSEHDLKMAFSQFGPIKSLNLANDPVTGHHKGYCFMEFETPEAAAMAVESLNGSELGGRSVKIGRPNNFPLELPQGLPPAHDTRLYISNVHKQVTEEDISAVLATFGTLRQVSLVPDVGVGTHKGYGFVEFSNRGDAATALAALKAGFSLGGLKIRVGRTIIGGDMPPGMAILRKVPQQRDDKVVQVRKKLEEELTRN